MKYKSFTGSASQTLEVTKSCLGIAIVADTAFANEKLAWDYVPQNGTQILGSKSRPLTLFQEVDSFLMQEGHANRWATNSDVVVRFSPFGELELSSVNSVVVRLTELDPTKTYDVYLVEHPEISTTLVKFENSTLESGQTQHQLINKNYEHLVIPDNGSITEVMLTFSGVDGSKVVNYPIELIRILSTRQSDMVVRTSKTSGIFGYDNNHVMDMSGVERIEFRTDETEQQVFFIKSVSKEGGN